MKRPLPLFSAPATGFALGYTLLRYSEIQLRVEESNFASIREMKILHKLGYETKADYGLKAQLLAQVEQAKEKRIWEDKQNTNPRAAPRQSQARFEAKDSWSTTPHDHVRFSLTRRSLLEH